MDLVHKLTLTALLGLTVSMAALLGQNYLSVKNLPKTTAGSQLDLQRAYDEKIAKNGVLYASVIQLLQEKQFSQAEEKLAEIETSHPDNPQSLIYRAQLQYGQGQVAAAIHSYRLAVNSAPDYVDKATPFFMGDQIMDIISEARGKLLREKKLKPGDTGINLALEDIYYLQRRIAGGCE